MKNKGLKIIGYRLAVSVFLLLSLTVYRSPLSAQELLNYPLDTVNGEEVYKYQVERSIGLYRIGVNFDVPQNELIRLNPQLRERGLHYGETLLIPTKRPVTPQQATPAPVQEAAQPETAKPDTVVPTDIIGTLVPAGITDTTDSVVPDPRHVIELALMLPFESRQTKRSGNAERMSEFYQGALLALHDVQNDSTLYRLRVYDTERSERRVRELCDSTELDSVRGILGLVYPIQIERMAGWCDEHHVPLLLPFSDDTELAVHPQVLQFNSTDKQEADSLCAWIAERDSMLHCVLLDVRDADITSPVRTLRQYIRARGISTTKLPLHDLMIDSAEYAMDPEKENLIILHSDRFQQIRILLPHIEKLRDAGFTVRIVGQYAWEKESIALPQVYTSMFTSEASREAYETLWARYFQTKHVSDAPRYDMLGYDLMRALVAWLQGEKAQDGLQSAVRWEQVRDGGWQNGAVKVIER